jgi:hypothetical protein
MTENSRVQNMSSNKRNRLLSATNREDAETKPRVRVNRLTELITLQSCGTPQLTSNLRTRKKGIFGSGTEEFSQARRYQ